MPYPVRIEYYFLLILLMVFWANVYSVYGILNSFSNLISHLYRITPHYVRKPANALLHSIAMPKRPIFTSRHRSEFPIGVSDRRQSPHIDWSGRNAIKSQPLCGVDINLKCVWHVRHHTWQRIPLFDYRRLVSVVLFLSSVWQVEFRTHAHKQRKKPHVVRCNDVYHRSRRHCRRMLVLLTGWCNAVRRLGVCGRASLVHQQH